MKKPIYILLTILLILELNLLLHAGIESLYIKHTLTAGNDLMNTKFLGYLYCVLPSWFNYGSLLTALIGGYFLGQLWWRIVYIEKRHWHRFGKR